MLALLLLPPWIGYFARFRRNADDWRDAALQASVIWGILILGITESLSLVSGISLRTFAAVWFTATVFSLRRITFPLRLPEKLRLSEGLMLAGIALVGCAVACSAIFSTPNNWDSMTYHLPRVAHWVDQQSVHFYVTHNLRQLYLGPWAEFAILHLRVLSGTDRLSALVQFAAMLGSLVGVSRIARRAGADRTGQIFAAVCCVTIPMGILQASSTQNDYASAFRLVCFVNASMDRSHAWAGASLGLLVLTKLSAALFALPFFLWAVAGVRARDLAIACSLALAINVPHLARNLKTFGSPLGPPDSQSYVNQTFAPSAIAANVIRNVAVHAQGFPPGSVDRVVHRIIGDDDPRTTFLSTKFVVWQGLHEDYSGNPLHLLLAIGAIALCLRRPGISRNYSLILAAGALLFCAVLKWQPWISRLQLPWFVLAAVPTAIAFRRVAPWLSAVLVIAAAWPATTNAIRPLIGPANVFVTDSIAQTFAARPELRADYVAAASLIGDRAEVGLLAKGDSWEYPLWRLAPKVRFRNRALETIVVLDGAPVPPSYSPMFKAPNIAVYRGAIGVTPR